MDWSYSISDGISFLENTVWPTTLAIDVSNLDTALKTLNYDVTTMATSSDAPPVGQDWQNIVQADSVLKAAIAAS